MEPTGPSDLVHPSPSDKSTGPRTAQGKRRSKFNALKHGVFSKVVLLKGESQTEYLSLWNGLSDDFQPQGKAETLCVEELTVALWRMRRLIQAENAEISEKVEFAQSELAARRYTEAWDWSRASGGLLKCIDNPLVVREARLILQDFRESFIERGFRKDSQILKRLYGETEGGGLPYGFRMLYETVASDLAKEHHDKLDEAEIKKLMVQQINAKIDRLHILEDQLNTDDERRSAYNSAAAISPSSKCSVQGTHLSRDIDRILNRLERLQRMRRGQPSPAPINVTIS